MDRKRKLVSIVRGNRGQSVIEFALVFPLLLLLLFGITEFGRAWMTKNLLVSAAREGCRLAVVTGPDVARVTNKVNDVCTSSGITPTSIVIDGPAPGDPDRSVTVTVSADFQVLTGTLLGPFSGVIPISATSVMRHEAF